MTYSSIASPTIRQLVSRRATAMAFCGNAMCHRFRDGAATSLSLSALPEEATIEDVRGVLACSACDHREAEIVIAPAPLRAPQAGALTTSGKPRRPTYGQRHSRETPRPDPQMAEPRKTEPRRVDFLAQDAA